MRSFFEVKADLESYQVYHIPIICRFSQQMVPHIRSYAWWFDTYNILLGCSYKIKRVENCGSVSISLFCFENVEFVSRKTICAGVDSLLYFWRKLLLKFIEYAREHASSQDTCERWLSRFKTCDFNVEDHRKNFKLHCWTKTLLKLNHNWWRY